jgi:predicted DNA-binding transcriptional regulator AlpA
MNQHVGAESGSLIPKPNLARELGVSSRTLSRWLDDESIGFPKPIVIRQRNYFDRASVDGWKADRLRASVRTEAA